MTHYLDKRLDEAQKSLDEMLEFSIKLDGKAGRKGSRTIAAIRNRALRVRVWLDGIESHASATDEMLQRAAAIRADASELYESVRPVENQKRERRQRTTTTTTTPRGDGDLAQRVLVLEQQTDALGKIATQQAATIGLLCRRSMRPDVAGAWARVMSGLPQSGDHQAVYDWLRAIRESGEDRGDVYKEALNVSR